jgi:hypothetical protein
MTGDPDEHDDILGFGHTDRAPRAFRLGIRLDRLTLRITRRPRLAAASAALAALALTVGGTVAYLGPAHAVVPTSAQPQPISTQCAKSSQGKLISAALANFLKQLHQKAPSDRSLAYSSTITISVGTIQIRTPSGSGASAGPMQVGSPSGIPPSGIPSGTPVSGCP